MEIWKDIDGYEGYYRVSSNGRIQNVNTGKILKGDVNSIGYKRVWLYTPIPKRMFIHRLVAAAFCDGWKEDKVVNHKDGNKQNNVFTNLEWVTRSENDLHAFRLGLRSIHRCSFRHKIFAYDTNGNLYKVYANVQDCCDDLGVARSNVYNCCNGKQLTCKGYKLSYTNN